MFSENKHCNSGTVICSFSLQIPLTNARRKQKSDLSNKSELSIKSCCMHVAIALYVQCDVINVQMSMRLTSGA